MNQNATEPDTSADNEIPPYAMPYDYMRKTLITELIKYVVCKDIFDEVSGAVLDVRTCAVLIQNDDVIAVRDPEVLRAALAKSETRAALLELYPGLRVLYQDKKRRKPKPHS